jgi:hypothetical protein
MRQLLLILIWIYSFVTTSCAPVCESCHFDTSPRSEKQCSVYGTFSGDLVPWYRASESCLDSLGINLTAIDKDKMWVICPFANADDVRVDRLKIFLRDEDTEASNAIRALFPNFFQPGANGTYELLDTITASQAQIVNCTQSRNLCWGAIGTYFGIVPEETARLCSEMHKLQIPTLIEEQTTARESLCSMDPMDANFSDCEPLLSQIDEVKEKNLNAECSEFSAGAGNLALPNCTTASAAGGGSAAPVRVENAFGAAIASLLVALYL